MPTVLSLFSRRHRRSPATSPALLLVATSLSTSAVHPPSPFSLSSHSRCRPTATTLPPPLSLSSLRPLHIRPLSLRLGIIDRRRLLSLSSTALSLFAFSMPSLRPQRRSLSASDFQPPRRTEFHLSRRRCSSMTNGKVVVDTAAASSLSSLLRFLRLPDVLLWVISASARTSMASKLVALDPPPPLLRSLSLLAFGLGPFLSHRCRRRGLLHRRLPYSSSTDVVAASLFSIAALPPYQRPKRVLVRQRHRPFSSLPPSAATAVDSSRRWASARGRRWCLPHPLQLLGW